MISEEEWDLASRITKEDFINKFKATVLDWVKNKEAEIQEVLDKKKYSVDCKSFEASIKKRNQLEKAINDSRRKNNGAVNLKTLDEICKWGFKRDFPLRDEERAKQITKEAFEYVDKGDYFEAVLKLMTAIKGVSISRASKIVGLSDQNKLCIYDSRVGHALRDMKKRGIKLVKCPPDRSYKRDFDNASYRDWAMNYERLIWIIEILREYFKTKNFTLRAADIEIALYVIGKN